LIEITANILRYRDEKGEPLVPKIRDAAGQKGTGKWTSASGKNCLMYKLTISFFST
jgi:6-phosphogluconate dehydrogenase